MSPRLRLLFVCDRQFGELPGDDPEVRRCDTCATQVHNLDALGPAAQTELLRQAAARATTVCVSLALPPALAQACRKGEAVRPQAPDSDVAVVAPEAIVELAGVAVYVPATPALPPPRWRGLAADAPAVTAAVEALAAGFALRAVAEGRWALAVGEPPLRGELVVQADGAGARVGLAIAPVSHEAPMPGLSAVATAGILVGGLWMMLTATAGWAAASLGLLVAPLLIGGTMIVALVVRAVVRLARRLRARRWARGFERRLWPALADRLGPGRLYR